MAMDIGERVPSQRDCCRYVRIIGLSDVLTTSRDRWSAVASGILPVAGCPCWQCPRTQLDEDRMARTCPSRGSAGSARALLRKATGRHLDRAADRQPAAGTAKVSRWRVSYGPVPVRAWDVSIYGAYTCLKAW